MLLHRFFRTAVLAAAWAAPLLSLLSASQPALSQDEEQIIHNDLQRAVNEPGTASFTPPAGWHIADPKALPKSVKVMVVGKGAYEFPPSINLGTETYSGTLKQYLKRIKQINASRGAQWKDLGTIRTEAGNASLSQVELKNQWGDVKMMHVILLKDGIVYIMTAASRKDEFPRFYKEFFSAMRSFKLSDDTSPPQANGE